METGVPEGELVLGPHVEEGGVLPLEAADTQHRVRLHTQAHTGNISHRY